GLENMPQWAHLPLILKPDGNGKLSKRDGDRLGFPVYAMDWKDPQTGDLTKGFKEIGFLPEAFINLLAVLGWNDGSEQEIFTINELTERFSIERVHKGGAKFDFEKAKWFNHEWIKRSEVISYKSEVKTLFTNAGIAVNDEEKFEKVLALIKDRCTLLPDFIEQGKFFFVAPSTYDERSVKPKWDEGKKDFFNSFISNCKELKDWKASEIENNFKELATAKNIKVGELQMIFRVMLVGSKMGPGVFVIAEAIGKEETIQRIGNAVKLFN
ncbi:MAG TPA: glutamate--tRNA ligase family protein, partial [Ferruginibacter sp.]|nr:glutamate--tRNA ligase family protein [Ferruginibacter sp.]